MMSIPETGSWRVGGGGMYRFRGGWLSPKARVQTPVQGPPHPLRAELLTVLGRWVVFDKKHQPIFLVTGFLPQQPTLGLSPGCN